MMFLAYGKQRRHGASACPRPSERRRAGRWLSVAVVKRKAAEGKWSIGVSLRVGCFAHCGGRGFLASRMLWVPGVRMSLDQRFENNMSTNCPSSIVEASGRATERKPKNGNPGGRAWRTQGTVQHRWDFWIERGAATFKPTVVARTPEGRLHPLKAPVREPRGLNGERRPRGLRRLLGGHHRPPGRIGNVKEWATTVRPPTLLERKGRPGRCSDQQKGFREALRIAYQAACGHLRQGDRAAQTALPAVDRGRGTVARRWLCRELPSTLIPAARAAAAARGAGYRRGRHRV